MSLQRRSTTSLVASTQHSNGGGGGGSSSSPEQIVSEKYIDPVALRAYMEKNFARGTWKVQCRLGKFIITTPTKIPNASALPKSQLPDADLNVRRIFVTSP
ncbi:uncharacterized protein Z519_00939 [Cladophialophora bantiana CBS 173.52]|uniref:Uncharacterized protein n=1 Tax=Cladophialophora bantiana (strain ATCC 10958 / CBS 173.52 / CDC B-1940 / NIH 8579) TaxID=1442370 RepID=A0A0D2FAX7_CLAB1|nr:uncharacterized protein Z519_00939 [Cladophialophora bantiana CBS 173.52]KIW99276.1 hypothetical protein Z519_00939 [Cladophialophora bantiana CBS 173.52]